MQNYIYQRERVRKKGSILNVCTNKYPGVKFKLSF